MDSTFLYSGTYEDIIQTIAKWRILSLTTLKEELNYNFSYQAFAKKVGRLEKENLVGAFYYENNKKYLYLTDKGLKEAGLEKSWPINKEIVVHDLISVNICRYMLNGDKFVKGLLHLDEAGKTTQPDFVMWFNQDDYSANKMAVDVELTQKSVSRIENKFQKYHEDNEYDLILYIIQKTSHFEAYKKVIAGMRASHRKQKVILLLEPEVRKGDFNFVKSICYFDMEIADIESIYSMYKKTVPKS